MVLQLMVNWTGPGKSPKVSVLNYSVTEDIPGKVTALRAFLTSYAAWMDTSYRADIDPEYRVLNTVTGGLEEVGTIASPGASIVGTVNSEPVADIAQILVQWRTQTIVSGRFLRGRTFLPGFAQDFAALGNPTASACNSIAASAMTLLATGDGPAVWSRRHGVATLALSATVWTEFAAQRNRRG